MIPREKLYELSLAVVFLAGGAIAFNVGTHHLLRWLNLYGVRLPE